MSPLLFAVVDATLTEDLRLCRKWIRDPLVTTGAKDVFRRRVKRETALLGWWRSCWPISR